MNTPSDSPQVDRTRWDLFCRVVDNFGDIGVCWRLAQQLSSEYSADVRLWVDDLDRLRNLCSAASSEAAKQRVGAIEVCQWPVDFPVLAPADVADVVIEAFGCEIPANYVTAMSLRAQPPVWINLEYLSAEDWVEECHGLASPQPRLPLKKHFFFPGFTPHTGGLLRERGLLEARAGFDRAAAAAFWKGLGIPLPAEGEIRISLFCYENSAIPALLDSLAMGSESVGLLVTPGFASSQVEKWFEEPLPPGTSLTRGSLVAFGIPFLTPSDYDRLLWACDINFVRGEDSFVRAQWAQRPFLWQIYPQADQAHLVKLEAFLTRYLGEFSDFQAARNGFLAWNGVGNMSEAWPPYAANRGLIEQHGKVWARQLDQTVNLADNLVRFVRAHSGCCARGVHRVHG